MGTHTGTELPRDYQAINECPASIDGEREKERERESWTLAIYIHTHIYIYIHLYIREIFYYY